MKSYLLVDPLWEYILKQINKSSDHSLSTYQPYGLTPRVLDAMQIVRKRVRQIIQKTQGQFGLFAKTRYAAEIR